VAWARAEQLKVIPLCPFARSVFQRDESLRDVLA
jgi:predicted GNAT family acetyltransferase